MDGTTSVDFDDFAEFEVRAIPASEYTPEEQAQMKTRRQKERERTKRIAVAARDIDAQLDKEFPNTPSRLDYEHSDV